MFFSFCCLCVVGFLFCFYIELETHRKELASPPLEPEGHSVWWYLPQASSQYSTGWVKIELLHDGSACSRA